MKQILVANDDCWFFFPPFESEHIFVFSFKLSLRHLHFDKSELLLLCVRVQLY